MITYYYLEQERSRTLLILGLIKRRKAILVYSKVKECLGDQTVDLSLMKLIKGSRSTIWVSLDWSITINCLIYIRLLSIRFNMNKTMIRRRKKNWIKLNNSSLSISIVNRIDRYSISRQWLRITRLLRIRSKSIII